MRPASEIRFLSGYRTDGGTSSSYAAYSEIKNDGITLPMRKVDIETDGCLALSTIPAKIAKNNRSIQTRRGANSRCFIAIERWTYPEENLN
jgi:hypothetical protein